MTFCETGGGTHTMTSQLRRGEGEIGVMKYRATHGGGPIGPQLRHQTAFSLLMSSFLGGPINPQAVRKKVARTP